MFQFPALASILDGWYSFRIPGCPIRRFTDQGLFAPPRDFSQLITSFIASESQGIRHAPLLTFLITSHWLAVWDDIYFKLSYFFICLLHHVIELLSWWRITDSNRWPPACKAGALASWANPPFFCGCKGKYLHPFRQNFREVFFRLPFEVVPGRVELPTSTLSV